MAIGFFRNSGTDPHREAIAFPRSSVNARTPLIVFSGSTLVYSMPASGDFSVYSMPASGDFVAY